MAQGGIGASVGFSADVDDVLIDQLKELEFVLGREFMAWFLGVEITQYLQKRADLRFQREGKVGGETAWRPLAEATRQERRAQGFGGAHPINERTGEMREWVTTADSAVLSIEGGAELNWPAVLPPEGSELFDKVQTAQRGKKKNSYGSYTPPRPVLRFSELDFIHLLSTLAMHMRPGGVRFDG